jgi:Matrixin
VGCNVTLRRAGQITVFDTPVPADIYKEADFQEVCAAPGYVHAVGSINYCGGLYSTNIIGCSTTPGKCMVVVRYATDVADIEGILWAHEYGHTKGLQHRNDESAIMNPYVGGTERGVNATECHAFQGTKTQQGRGKQPTARPSVVDFVHRTYFEGTPYAIASTYGTDDAKTLLQLLDKTEERPFYSNIVTTLGMIGDPVAVEPLKRFITKGEGTIDVNTARAKTTAVTALGYIVNKSHDEGALQFLAMGMQPKNWESHVQWLPLGQAASDRTFSLVRASIFGLAFAGTPEAETVLASSKIQLSSALEPKLGEKVAKDIDEALKINNNIQHETLQKYLSQ